MKMNPNKKFEHLYSSLQNNYEKYNPDPIFLFYICYKIGSYKFFSI